jgi:ornithine carbamoyltransferase
VPDTPSGKTPAPAPAAGEHRLGLVGATALVVGKRRADLTAYAVTEQLMAKASSRAVFLHCLPAHPGEEVEAAVIDGPQSLVFMQAANRLPTEQALIHWTIQGGHI